jgi:hypothetical protein
MNSILNGCVVALAIAIPTTASALYCNGNWQYLNNLGCQLVLSYNKNPQDVCLISVLSSSSGTAYFDIYILLIVDRIVLLDMAQHDFL